MFVEPDHNMQPNCSAVCSQTQMCTCVRTYVCTQQLYVPTSGANTAQHLSDLHMVSLCSPPRQSLRLLGNWVGRRRQIRCLLRAVLSVLWHQVDGGGMGGGRGGEGEEEGQDEPWCCSDVESSVQLSRWCASVSYIHQARAPSLTDVWDHCGRL